MSRHWSNFVVRLLCVLSAGSISALHGQALVDVTVQFKNAPTHSTKATGRANDPAPAAIWLTPLASGIAATPSKTGNYTLLQKNKQFSPHVLVVPVGAVVHFPNADPFFHNVFSRFDGRRFDLGLYEAGSTRDVTFNREGISYIFCDIHPEMSAVVIALSTPFFGVADSHGHVRIIGVPSEDYVLHVWVQGQDQAALNGLSRRVHIAPNHADLGDITLPPSPSPLIPHEDKYGKDYDTRAAPVY